MQRIATWLLALPVPDPDQRRPDHTQGRMGRSRASQGCRHRVEALVHLAHRECDDYSLGGLCDGPLATEGSRASGRQHHVQDSHTDCSLGLLGSEAARSHPRSDLGLIAAHRRFDQCALAVVGGCLADQSAPFCDHRQMAITLCRWTRIGAGHCCRPRRDHHVDAIAVRCDRLVRGPSYAPSAVTRTIRPSI
jgi:hypothetical protein